MNPLWGSRGGLSGGGDDRAALKDEHHLGRGGSRGGEHEVGGSAVAEGTWPGTGKPGSQARGRPVHHGPGRTARICFRVNEAAV